MGWLGVQSLLLQLPVWISCEGESQGVSDNGNDEHAKNTE